MLRRRNIKGDPPRIQVSVYTTGRMVVTVRQQRASALVRRVCL